MGFKLLGDVYERHTEIGRGTYGTVYVGLHRPSQRRVAIKKVHGHPGSEAGDAEAILLRRCVGAEHVVQLEDVVRQNGKVYLILEYMDTDLETILQATDEVPELSLADIKAYLQMLLRGVHELHTRGILHRDLKPNNLLISRRTGTAKLADFGMATQLAGANAGQSTPRALSLQVITRAYRPPELFFGKDHYDGSVDMWSVGCIFAELVLRRPYFDGSSDIDQLSQIFSALGSPDERGWTSAAALPFYLKFRPTQPQALVDQFPRLPSAGIDLLNTLLQLDPSNRCTAEEALSHAFFTENPVPTVPTNLTIVDPPDRVKKTKRHRDETTITEATSEEDAGLLIKGRRIV